MPTITVSAGPAGPLLSVAIGCSFPRTQVLLANNQPVPTVGSGQFLVDTGASMTCVDPDVIAHLNLPLIGSIMIATPSTNGVPVACEQYDASVLIPGASVRDNFVIPAIPILATKLKPQGIEGLLGRDIIDRCLLVYNGPARILSLGH
jgi:hypothetical protein